MTTGANGQKACILRTDEKHDAIWHHGAGKGLKGIIIRYHLQCSVGLVDFCIPRILEDGTSVSKHVVMMLITNCVL